MDYIKILLLLIHIFHKILVITVMCGFLFPKKYLIYHLISWPLVWLHWELNNNYCFLTQIERRLNEKINPKIKNKEKNNSEFMKKIFNDMGIYISVEKIDILTKLIFTTSWLITVFRYFN